MVGNKRRRSASTLAKEKLKEKLKEQAIKRNLKKINERNKCLAASIDKIDPNKPKKAFPQKTLPFAKEKDTLLPVESQE